MESTGARNRLTFLDWLRGVAGIVMLQGHVFQSFLKPDLRGGAAYMFSQFFGGMPPAIFLFLTGITLAFLMFSFERKGVARASRITGTLRRAGYLFGIAMLLRVQLWLFSWPSPWTNLLKVDILNCMGFGIALMSALALFSTAQRVRICAALGLLIAGLSPLASQVSWTGVPWIVKAYIAPDYNYFSFFPWAAYVAFGMSAGSLIRLLKHEQYDRAMQWAAMLGVGIILAARYFANLPFSPGTLAQVVDTTWRRHSCLPRPHSCGRLALVSGAREVPEGTARCSCRHIARSRMPRNRPARPPAIRF
jgi:uncharacterized membrane protein